MDSKLATDLDPSPETISEPTNARPTGNFFHRFRRSYPLWTGAIIWLVALALISSITLLTRTYVVQAYYVTSGSMEPTLESGDRIFANKLSYNAHDVNRGDVVIIDRAAATSSISNDTSGLNIDDLVKRVIGLPGETIRIYNCTVTIDGYVLSEPYLATYDTTSRRYQEGCRNNRIQELKIPTGYIFVMGDNRLNSVDSRSFGVIPEDSIVGRAFLKAWPFWRISLL